MSHAVAVLGLLIYSDATGCSQPAHQQMTYENVAVRLLCGDTHPITTRSARSGGTIRSLSRSFAQCWSWPPAAGC